MWHFLRVFTLFQFDRRHHGMKNKQLLTERWVSDNIKIHKCQLEFNVTKINFMTDPTLNRLLMWMKPKYVHKVYTEVKVPKSSSTRRYLLSKMFDNKAFSSHSCITQPLWHIGDSDNIKKFKRSNSNSLQNKSLNVEEKNLHRKLTMYVQITKENLCNYISTHEVEFSE